MMKCCGEVEEGGGDSNPVCRYFGKKDHESLSLDYVVSAAVHNSWGCDMA